jgi:hypothetical protein
MRVVIACGGREQDPKWNSHLGVPKHLAPVAGRPLLERTVEQVGRYTGDVVVTAPPDPRYQVVGADVVHPDPAASNEYTGTRPWWSTTTRTLLLLGDVYWTDAAVRLVCTDTTPLRWFGRFGASKVTAARWGEIFAVAWLPRHHALLDAHLAKVDAAREITRPPGWKLYRSLHGLPMRRHRKAGDWCDIDDGTDDFDTPAVYAAHPAIRGSR